MMDDDSIARTSAVSKRASSAILVLILLGLSHLFLNENRFYAQYQVRSTFAADEMNGSSTCSDLSVAEMKATLDELNGNMKLLLARPTALDANSPNIAAATAALEAATAMLSSAIMPVALQSHDVPLPFPYHVMYGLDGDEPGFLQEFEVSLKSILLNAPLDDPLDIHLLASEKSYAKLGRIFKTCLLPSFRTRNPITIHVYNVQPLVPSWGVFLSKYFQTHWNSTVQLGKITGLHTLGAYFRLFAHHVLPNTVDKVLYLDNDAILMANMREIWKDVAANNPSALFHWGEHACSGFMVFNNHRIHEVWEYAKRSNLSNIPLPYDQDVLRAVNASFPEEVGILSPAWDVSVANEMWKVHDKLEKARPNLGMMHFNGGGSDPRNAFKVHNFLKHNNSKKHPNWTNTWHLARYYGNMPWVWARYWVKSMVTSEGESGNEGYPIKIIPHVDLKLKSPLNWE